MQDALQFLTYLVYFEFGQYPLSFFKSTLQMLIFDLVILSTSCIILDMICCGQNYMRVVEVWLDREHREYFYTREPSVRGYPVGDISKQIQFKEEHKCKDFKWFMENVAYEVYERFPKLPPNKAWGEVRK